MWLAKQMAARADGSEQATAGHVTAVKTGLTVSADGEYRDVSMYAPPGISSRPKMGDPVLLLEANGEKQMVGAKCDTEGLLPGELRLRSAGGAEIVLKNNGQVVINGRVF